MILRRNEDVSFPTDLVRFSREGLVMLREPSLEEWQQLHSSLSVCGRTHKRWMADSRRFGRRFFGDDAVQMWESQLELAMPELKAMEALESLETRSPGLNDEHHLVLSKRCEAEADRARWAQVAVEEKLTPTDLQASIKAGHVVRKSESDGDKPGSLNAHDKSAGLVTIEGISMQHEHWKRKVTESGFPFEWDEDRLRRVADLLRPFMQDYLSCMACLNDAKRRAEGEVIPERVKEDAAQ